jgi:hypothetical protein
MSRRELPADVPAHEGLTVPFDQHDWARRHEVT